MYVKSDKKLPGFSVALDFLRRESNTSGKNSECVPHRYSLG